MWCLKLRYRRNQLLIFLLQRRYGFCLLRKGLILFVGRCLICLDLLACECKLIAKHGLNWRDCVFDNQVVEFLKLLHHAHGVIMPNSIYCAKLARQT